MEDQTVHGLMIDLVAGKMSLDLIPKCGVSFPNHEAVQKFGSTAIGLKTKEGVVLAVEKRITSPLLESSSVEMVMEIDDHIGCAMSTWVDC
ncbi:hypothetical protein QQ045_002849 [Rhodiola kirilowii]